ncbi:phosphatidylglycerol lysyltransferase domain-containing protein [Nonomuraea antimicrobica]
MSRSAVPTVAGYLAVVIGAVNILRVVHPGFEHTRLAEIAALLPGAAVSLAAATSLVAGMLLIMLAHALRRRKRRAWRLVIVLLPVNALIGELRWGHLLTAAVTFALFGVLLAARKEFYALSDPRTRWRSLWAFLLLGVVDVLVGWAVVNTRSHAMVGTVSLSDRWQEVLLGLVGIDGPIAFATARTADLVYFSLLGLGTLTAVTTLYLALRPERPVAGLTLDEERAVRDLLREHGERDSLGYFALRSDKSAIFSASGKAVVSYRVTAGVMLASGDPIGDVEAWPGAIKEFMDKARRHAWVPAVIGCSQTGGTVWCREAGLSALELGDEAIVEVADFGLQGRQMRNVRQMIHRIERTGTVCRVRRVTDLDPPERDRMRQAAQAWRGREHARGFSMALGRIGDPADPGCVVVTAHRTDDPAAAPSGRPPWGTCGRSCSSSRGARTASPST